MLLNEFLKEHRKVEEQVRANQEQQANIAELKSAVAAQRDKTKTLEVMLAEQTAQIQKVSAQLAASDQSLPRIVVNDQSSSR
jgi:septal ring factor EnvC (AmiA/AmiB activator)